MMSYVVDTNVAVIANGKSPQADPDCVIACIDELVTVRDSSLVVLDNAMLILREYMCNLSLSGQPGAGDLFMKWVWNIQADESRCERVKITPKLNDAENFEEFPDDSNLRKFDPKDRKFVAVALASLHGPTILNAVDSDWAQYHMALTQHGVKIQYLCPQHTSPEK